MIQAYREQQEQGKCFVHARKRHSSNHDLRALQALTNNDKLYSVSLRCGGGEASRIVEDAESVVTNSESLAKAIVRANCNTCKEVEDAVNEEVKKQALWRDVPLLDANYTKKVQWCNYVCFSGDKVFFYSRVQGSKGCPEEKRIKEFKH